MVPPRQRTPKSSCSFLKVCLFLGLALAGFAPGALAAGSLETTLPPGRLAFRSYGSEVGLTNLSIWALEQDRDGFLWAATASGLFRYDGARFQRFGMEDGLPSSRVRALHGSPSGRLWVGTLTGLGYVENGQCHTLTADQGLPMAEVFALAQDGEGLLWVGTGAGLFRQISGTQRFEPAPGWPKGTMALTLWVDPGRLLVAGGERLFQYDLRTGGSPHEIRGPWTHRLEGLARDGGGRLWVRTRGELWMQPAQGGGFQDFSAKLPATSYYDAQLAVDNKGGLLIPHSKGLIRVTGDHWDYLNDARGLPIAWVSRVLVDREGSLWLGGMGIFRSLGGSLWQQYTHKDAIPSGVVDSLLRDREGRLWLGSVDGLFKFSPKGWEAVPGTQHDVILDLAQDRTGAIWMGGAPPRLRRWDPASNLWTEFPQVKSTITSLHVDPEGNVWVASRRSGLWKVSGREGALRCEPVSLPGGTPDERIETIAGGSKGRIWVAGSLGLAVLEQGAWKRLTPAEGLPSLHILAVRERNRGDLWISGMESPGIYQFAYEDGALTPKKHLTTEQGLSSDQVYFIKDDTKGRLWVGTSLGVNLLEGATVHAFGTAEGLPGDDLTQNGFFAEANGEVWVGTQGGLALFNSSAYTGFPVPPKSFILSAQFGGKPVPVALAGAAPLQVAFRDATAEFKFTGLTYLNENKVRHQVRLVGWDGDTWRAADFRQVRFTNLAPGSYCLEVRAGYGTGTWGEPASYSFVVLPPWWRTWWFRGLAFLILGGLAALAVSLRLQALRRRNRELEKLVKARTAALAQANQTLQQLTVTDPLTGLKNRRFLDLTIEDDLGKVRRDYFEAGQAGRGKNPLNLDMLFFMVDLDHFKRVNDTHGHAAGDLVLRQVRDRLLQAVRETDTVVRWGGEEFLVVARTYDRSQAATLAQRILDLMRSQPFDIGDGKTLAQTCSVGFAPYPLIQGKSPEAVTWQRVVEVADCCLYAAKESGRNAWVGVINGVDPDRVVALLANPEREVVQGQWEVATSLDPGAPLKWHGSFK